MQERILEYRVASPYADARWATRLFLVSIPLLIASLVGPIYSYASMKSAQAREGKIVLDSAKDAPRYRKNIEDIPGIIATTGAALSCLLLRGIVITRKVPPPVGLFILGYPLIWYATIFLIALNSFEAFL